MALNTNDVKAAYSRVFSTGDGQIILADILCQLGYFNNVPESINPKCIAIANTILSRCGVLDSGGTGVYMEGLSYSIGLAMTAGMKKAADDMKEETDDEI